MTVDQFKQKLEKSEKFSDVLNYLTCTFFIGFGFWMIGDLAINKFPYPETDYEKYLILLFPLAFLAIGIYGFWRIPKNYQIGCVYSSKTIEEKWTIVHEYLSHLNVKSKTTDDNQIECIYRNKYLNSLVVRIHLDDDKILYNVQSLDTGDKGIIDLGLSKRATKRLKKFLENRL